MRQNSGKGGPAGETEADRHAARTACPEKERGAVMVALSSLPTDAEMLVRYGLKLAAGSAPPQKRISCSTIGHAAGYGYFAECGGTAWSSCRVAERK